MLKYVPEDTKVVFSEIPDEVTLAINISNCPHRCPGCHSPYLQKNVGEYLYGETLADLVNENDGVTCILFMGEGNDEESLIDLIYLIRHLWGRDMKIGLYTGGNHVSEFLWENLDYIKLGPYIKDFGPLNDPRTNQRLYKRESWETVRVLMNDIDGKNRPNWRDITYRFWRKGTE